MTNAFDKDFWETHWQQSTGGVGVSPYVDVAVAGLTPGSALDAGCGEGVEAVWLAEAGWQVTAADISATVLARAAARVSGRPDVAVRMQWVEADLSVWEPDRQFDLVMTHYTHPATAQLEFYERIAGWVAPGGTLLIVGHLHHTRHGQGHGADHVHPDIGSHRPPEAATATAHGIASLLDPARWEIVTAAEVSRTMPGGPTGEVVIDDVVVHARRTSPRRRADTLTTSAVPSETSLTSDTRRCAE